MEVKGKTPMKDISLLDLLKSGAHFGHNTSRWNPKMKPYIFGTRNHIHILDLESTKKALLKAVEYVKKTAGQGGTILFIGTKKQAKKAVKEAALSCNMPFVNVRWLGGTFTNFKTIQKTIRKMEKLENLKNSGELATKYTKKERLMIERELEKLHKIFEGISTMKKLPEAIFVCDVRHEEIAVKEAKKSRVKVIGLVDTNSNPDNIDFPIPCNDDSTKAIELVYNLVSEAINESRNTLPTAKEEIK